MKRLAATALWFYAAWYAGSFVATALGIPSPVGLTVGLLLGLGAGAFVGLDPHRTIWSPSRNGSSHRA